MSVHVRAGAATGREALFALVPRLRAFGPVPLRPPDALDTALGALAAPGRPPPDAALLELCLGGAAKRSAPGDAGPLHASGGATALRAGPAPLTLVSICGPPRTSREAGLQARPPQPERP